jgi:hypothetical protein
LTGILRKQPPAGDHPGAAAAAHRQGPRWVRIPVRLKPHCNVMAVHLEPCGHIEATHVNPPLVALSPRNTVFVLVHCG